MLLVAEVTSAGPAGHKLTGLSLVTVQVTSHSSCGPTRPMTGTFDHRGRQSHAATHASDHCSSSNGKPESGYPHISKQYPLISKRYPVRYPWDILLVSIRYSFISRYILLRYPNIRIFFASLKISHKYLRITVDIKVCENVRPQICGDFPRIYKG